MNFINKLIYSILYIYFVTILVKRRIVYKEGFIVSSNK